jgi:ABC-2 type transport system ATP-binding protein
MLKAAFERLVTGAAIAPHFRPRLCDNDGQMTPVLAISNLGKSYASGLVALKNVNLEIQKGEIFALLGPNGAGKTTLINIVCGIVNRSGGDVLVDGADIQKNYRAIRTKIGLVPQELATEMFEKVSSTVEFSRGVFGRAPNPAVIEKVLRDLSLWDKRNERIQQLSGGMKRRVMIAKALAHEPDLLFLDEPTAGVDVELRRDMWELVRGLRERGVTIILTTHYIEEAEEMADRVGVINKGELIVVEEKTTLMKKLGKRQLTLHLQEPLTAVPAGLADWPLEIKDNGYALVYSFDASRAESISTLLARMSELRIAFKDLKTEESSLEEIFVSLVHQRS